MSRQFAGRFWKWVVPAGVVVGLLGLWAPVGADDEKDPDVKKVIKKDGDEDRKDADRKEEPRKEADRKEESRKAEGRKEGQGDSRIDELAKMVKQLAGQVNELREEVRGLRGGFAGGPNPEEMRKRMEEMAKKFAASGGVGISPEKMKEEMERRFRAEKEKFAREGGDAEVQIRREIERLQGELKRIMAAKEGGDKVKKEEPRKEGGDAEEREAKERAAKREAKEREAKERDAKEREEKEEK